MKTLEIHDHFEYEEDNADIFDSANNVAIPGVPISIGGIRNIAGEIGGIFGKHEDKSDTGFKQFLSSDAGNLTFYPTKAEMLQAAQQGGWEKVEPAAIQASYDPMQGTWKRGDWNFKVISTNPIKAKSFKGAKESGTLSSNVNAAIPLNQLPSQAVAQAQQYGQQAIQSVQNAITNPSGQVATSPQIANPATSQPGGQPLNGGKSGGLLSGLTGGGPNMTLYLIGGAVAIVVLLLIMKK
jgi:hypothetical protein